MIGKGDEGGGEGKGIEKKSNAPELQTLSGSK